MRATILLLTLISVGCARIAIHRTSEPNPPLEKTTVQEHRAIIFGIETITQDLNLAERCPHGWESITTEQRFWQALLSTVTVNLYSPWTVRLQCSAPKAAPKEDD